MGSPVRRDYFNFTEAEFINDPFFQDWLITPNEENERFWNEFMKTYPHKREAIEKARTFLQQMNFEEEILDEGYIHQKYLEHLKQVHTQPRAKIFSLTIKRVASVAAVLVGVILVSLIGFFFFNKKESVGKLAVATRFGEIKKVLLPDGSSVTLNAHSAVIFSKAWSTDKPREIWLTGEAFIEVKHLNQNSKNVKPNERFLVHGVGYMIEVLGTSFNIRQRRGKTEIVLQTGKIKLTLKDSGHQIIMIPGDLITYTPNNNTLIRSTTIPENYSGWKEKKLLLNNATLEEIANYLEDNYSKKIVIKDEKLRKKKIEGIIQLNNLNDALFVISTTLNTSVEQTNDTILIRPK